MPEVVGVQVDGSIAGNAVRCETAAWSIECHTGYPPRPVDRQDIALLCAAFGADLPPDYT